MRPIRVSLVRLPGLAAAFAFAGGCTMDTADERLGQTTQAACTIGTVVQGVDVSVYQGTIDWAGVKNAGIDFAIARISDGSALDTEFAANWSGMKSAGIVRGAYQFFEPGEDPTTQANIVVNAVGMLGPGDLPVTADMEVTGGQSAATIAANLQTWMTAVEAGTGKTPMIYTGAYFWDGSVGGSTAFTSSPLWVANWGVSCPSLPTAWSDWTFWQYSDSGKVGGIDATVDLDEFNGSLAQLQAFAGGASTAPEYAAQYVSQSWPLASTTMTMSTCQTLAASITLRNVGTKTWDSNTRLATTQPRDRTSVLADSTWLSTNRLAQVTGTVAPGQTYEFKFDFHAPPTAGAYDEFFGVVEDGVAWFSDPGQGGPPDDDIEAKIQVTAGDSGCTVDPGVDSGTPADGDGGRASGTSDASTGDGGIAGGDEGGASMASLSAAAGGGCGCVVGATERADGRWALVLIGVAAVCVRRRRPAWREPPRPSTMS